MRIGSLCSGYGGLDLATEAHFGARTTWVADIDKDPSTVLAERFPHAPNLGDIKLVDWAEVPAVDIVTAGYPCQPFSQAGRQRGEDDPRHLWPEVYRAIRSLRPRYVVLENVQRHLRIGFGRVLADLAEAGFDAEWCLLRASEVGAPHRRARLFVLASRPCRRLATHPNGQRHEGPEPQPWGDGCRSDPRLAFWGRYLEAVVRWAEIIGRPPPPPLRADNPKQLNAKLGEWMMGLPEGWVTDLVPNRRALKVLGNGVVPQQAAAALRYLDGA